MSGEAVDRLRELLIAPSARRDVIVHLAPRLTAGLLVPAMYAARAAEHQFAGGRRVAAPALAAIGARGVELGEPFLEIGIDLAPFLPDDALPRAVELARTGANPGLLAALAPRVAETAGPAAALALLRTSAARSAYPEGIATELATIAGDLDEPAAAEALDLALAMSYPPTWLPIVAVLAPVLAPADARRAFGAVEALDGDARIPVLALLAPRVDARAVDRVRELAAALPPVARLSSLAMLAQQLPDDAAVAEEALAAADTAIAEYSGYDARPVMESLIGLAQAGFPVLDRALRHSAAPEIYDRAGTLVRLARAVAPEQRGDVIRAAVEAADDAAEPWRVLAELSELAPAGERAALEQRAFDAAGKISYEVARSEALDELSERFPHRAPPVEERAAPGEQAEAILAGVPAEERERVLAEAFWAHAGAPPPQAAPPLTPDEPPPRQRPHPAPRDEDTGAFEPVEAPPPPPAPPPPEPATAAPPEPEPTARPEDLPPVRSAPRSAGRRRRPIAKARRRRAPKPSRPLRPPKRPVVNTGFAEPDRPDRSVSPRRPLGAGRRYAFWLEVGEPVKGSIETVPTALPDDLPERARLTVVLSAVQGDVRIDGPAAGELEVRRDGSAAVVAPAAPGARDRPDRLVFQVDLGAASGEIALRCSISHRQVVLQSRLIRARVRRGALRLLPRRTPALRSELDYVLARTLDPPLLAQIPEHRLSLMLNGEDGTHAIQVVAADGGETVVHDATFEGGELEDLVRLTRGALRRAAWDSEDPWTETSRYRYSGAADPERLRGDLIRLAVRGWRFYDGCVNRLAGGYDASLELEELTRRPARIQVATRRNASLLLPAALFYDKGFDTGLPAEQIALCPAFLQALGDGTPLAGTACFQGDCPSRGDQQTVCPSGFWGFRHALGLPLSLGGEPEAADAAVFDIGYAGTPELSVAVSTDPQFVGRAAHEQRLRALAPGLRYADTRDEAIALLRETPGQIVYFYCHGGLTPTNVPYLAVGPKGEPGIPSDIFRAMRIRWRSPRPLVFLNGCHTTALDPGQALNFPARLVEVAAAAGVIGTEITNFEPLASAFAEECLARFLGGEAIGEAVRAARLALLAQANPLGLIYIPFVLPSVRLVAA